MLWVPHLDRMRASHWWLRGLVTGLLLCMMSWPNLVVAQVAPQPSGTPCSTVLWLTGEVTPGARTALVRQQLQAQGLTMLQVDLPFAMGTQPDLALERRLAGVLAQACAVWIDMPHPSVGVRLKKAFSPALQAWLQARPGAWQLWVPGEGAHAEHALSPWPPATAADTVTRWLSAGGAVNVRRAAIWQARALRGQAQEAYPPPPQTWPLEGLYHPRAQAVLPNAKAWMAWREGAGGHGLRPAVAVLVHRHHFVNGQTDWLDDWLRRFEAQGLDAVAVFAQQADDLTMQRLLGRPGDPGHSAVRVLVSHQLLTQGARLQGLLARWQTPLLITQPHRRGDERAWAADPAGLPTSDVPFYLAQPEAAGGIDPVVVTAHADGGQTVHLIGRQADAVVAKARRLIHLQTQPVAERQLVAMVYNYPPGGANFGASFLNVPRSLASVSAGLAQAGYQVPTVPEEAWVSGLKPLLLAYYPSETDELTQLLQQGQAAALPLSDYLSWFRQQPEAWQRRVEAQWGAPASSRYVRRWQGQAVFVIPRLRVGRLSVLPQPPREETLHQGQSPFMHRSLAPLSHHYLAVYLWARQADVLIHFGTHGTQEWAPGKARGLDVLDDAWMPLGDVPVVYPYIVDNLGEALTAKRRGRASMVSHRTPVFAPAGFEARMAHMHELMHEWETVDAGPTRQALERQLVNQFVEHNLHRDLGWRAEDIEKHFEGFLEQLHPYLDSLAQSSQPRGLAVFGQVPGAPLRQQTILQALRRPLIEALGEDIDEAFLIDHEGVSTSRPARWLQVALQDADAASRLDLRPPEPEGPVPNRQARRPIDGPALKALALRAQALEALLVQEGEMPGLLRALAGGFNEAAYGGDPIRNPDSLPTGRNLTGLDPARLPTRQAYEVAQDLFGTWLKERQAAGEPVPQRLALSLWAGETLRHQGIMEAQALVALGVRPVWDDQGKPTRLELVPEQALGRPRVDVLLSITGSYRDQFPALMALIDQAVALAARAEAPHAMAGAAPGNAIARNTALVEAQLRQAGVPAEAAARLARARVFGNVSGDYGTGLSEAVQSDELQANDQRLGDLFLDRMSQPFVDGQALDGVSPQAARQALGAHLRHTDAAFLSRSSHLYGMATSDDPFQYLGGLAAAARRAGHDKGLQLYVSQLQDLGEAHTDNAARVMSLEMKSRYLHPGWLKAQVQEGYAGTLQVLKAVQFTWGWQVTAPGMVRDDHWQSYFDVLVRDKHHLGMPQFMAQHPQAYAQTLERLVQAVRHGHWQPDAETRKQLAQAYVEQRRVVAPATPQAQAAQWADQAMHQAMHPSAWAEPVAAQAAVGLRVAAAGQSVAPPVSAPPAPARARRATPPAEAAQAAPMGWKLAPVPPAPERVRPAEASQVTALHNALVWCLLALWAACGALWQQRRMQQAL
jgi:cobaltochelatase CobN